LFSGEDFAGSFHALLLRFLHRFFALGMIEPNMSSVRDPELFLSAWT
jgi:hypothetical protein